MLVTKCLPKLFGIILLAAILQSCVSTKYKPVTLDSPVPMFESEKENVPLCKTNNVGDPATLLDGQSCYALVRADAWLSPSNIRVAKDQRYRIEIPPSQFWFDKSRRNKAGIGDDGNWLMNLFRPFKRDEKKQWFALTGATVKCVAKRERAKECDYSSEEILEKYELKNENNEFQGEIDVMQSGYLAFYPNDAVLFGWRVFYKNNYGQIWLRVTRVSK